MSLREEGQAGTALEGLVLTTFTFVHWMEADVVRLQRTALHLLARAEEGGLPKSAGYARYALGVAFLEADNLEGAEQTLKPLLESRLDSELANALYGFFTLALMAEGARGLRACAHPGNGSG